MKRVIAKERPEYVIDICAYLSDDVLFRVEMKHPNNIKKKYCLTDNELDIWTSVVDSVMSELTSRKFNIIQHGQSKSYSYYFNFYPVSETGHVFDLVQIRFRISNHRSDGQNADASSKQMFRKFTVNDIECPGSVLQLMNDVGKICDCLKTGNYSCITEI